MICRHPYCDIYSDVGMTCPSCHKNQQSKSFFRQFIEIIKRRISNDNRYPRTFKNAQSLRIHR